MNNQQQQNQLQNNSTFNGGISISINDLSCNYDNRIICRISNDYSIRLTPDNVSDYIGYDIRFKTRGDYITTKIKSYSQTGNSIIIDHPDLKNCLQITTRKIFVVIRKLNISQID